MNQSRRIFSLGVAFAALFSWANPEQNPSLSFEFPVQKVGGKPFENKITLKELKKTIPAKEIRYFDPLLRKVKAYSAFPLQNVLDAGFGKMWRNSSFSDLELVSSNGQERSSTKTYLLKDEGGYIAFRDLDSESWETLQSISIDGSGVSPGPFYMFWIGIDRSTPDEYPWFLSLAKLKLLRFEEQYPLVLPTGAKAGSSAYRGYEIFRGQCFKCHSINRQGGKVGPDLNAPKSVVAYRPTKLIKAFIKNPSQYRYTNMPDFTHLTEQDLEDLIAFFKFKDKNRNKSF